jgi:putative membrane protein
MKYMVVCAGCGLLPLALCGQTPATSVAPATLKGADRKFATMVEQMALAEIQVGNLALRKGSNDQAKKIAQRLVDDHIKIRDAMKQAATFKGLVLPTEPDAQHKALAAKLEHESGERFDKDFLAANSADHHKMVAAFQNEANKSNDLDMKSFAEQFMAAIQEHTQMIDQAKSCETK